MRFFWVLVALGALVASADAQTTIYKSIGRDGSIVYSDHPPADGKVEKTIEVAPELPSSPVPDAPAPQGEKKQKAAPTKARVAPIWTGGVLLYTTRWCGYCKRARAYLSQHGIAYQDIDIEAPAGRSAFTQAGGGGGGVPFMVMGSRRLRGFTPAGYDGFFANR